METLPAELFILVINQVTKTSPNTLFELVKLDRRSRYLLQRYGKSEWKSAACQLILQDTQFHEQIFDFDTSFLLFTAVNLSNYRALQALVYSGVDLNTRLPCYDYTPLMLAVSMNSISSTRILLNADVDSSLVDCEGYTVMHKACSNGNIEIFNLLETYSVDAKAKAYSQMTPLHCAAKFGHYELCKRLVKISSPNESTISEKTALHYAAYRTDHSPKIIQLFIDHGGDSQLTDIHGYTPLHVAALHGNTLGVKKLLENQVHVNSQTKSGSTPLHFAVKQDHPMICQSLMEAGANPLLENSQGYSPVDELVPENLNMDLREILLPTTSFSSLCWISFSFVFFGFKIVAM